MTIDELLAAAGLTANDEIPIWDAEATGEPTKKITAQQMAAGLMALGGYLSKNFSQFPTAVIPYTNTDLVPLYRNGTVYSTDMQTLINSAGGGGGTQQGALSNHIATYSFNAANTTHTFADSNLTAQMVIVAAYAPDGVSASLKPNITDGSITFTGTVSADCSIVFYFGVGLAAAPLLLVNLGSNVADNLLKAAPRPGVYNVLGLSNGGTGVNATDNADLLDKIGVTAAIQQSAAKIESGLYVPTEPVPANGYKDYHMVFGKVYSAPPVVVANCKQSFTPGTEMTGPNIVSIGIDGFTVRYKSSYSAALTPETTWIAIGN